MDRTEIEIKLEQLNDKISANGMSKIEKEEIMSELDSILNTDPNNTDALFMKAVVYQFTGDYESAIAIYQKISDLKPGDKMIEESIEMCKDFMKMDLGKIEEISKYVDNSVSVLPNIMEKISIWHILIFKGIVLAIIIYTLFIPLFAK